MEKVKPPAYVPLSTNEEDAPEAAVQQQVTFVQTPTPAVQPMMVMYTSGGLPLGPALQFVPTPVPLVVRPQTTVVTPNTHLVMTVIMFAILTVLAPETLVFMIPALILSILSNNANTRGQYARAKKLGHGALALNFIGLISAFVVAILCVALTLSLYPWRRPIDYIDYYYGGCFPDYSYGGGSGFDGDYPILCVN